MNTYKDMTRREIGEAYDNTSAVKNSSNILAVYEEKSQEVRNTHKIINIKYGNKERQNIDYYPTKKDAPLFVFIHGGYWQMRKKETFHFLVPIIEEMGYNVAFIGYTLAPNNNIAGIENEIFTAIRFLRMESKPLGFDPNKIVLSGWSAGAHLAIEALSQEGVVSAVAISGIYDLKPIAMCFLNDKLNLTTEDIDNFSPLRKNPPSKPINIVCGSGELPEIIRQSNEFHNHCKKNSSFKIIDEANHFSILLNNETFSCLKQHL